MIKINLLPRKKKGNILKFDIIVFFSTLTIALLSFGGIYYHNSKEIDRHKEQIQKTKDEISSLQSVFKEYQAMEREKKEIQRRIKAIDSIKEGRALAARVLYDLSSLIKDNVWIKNFRKHDDKFDMEGRSLENESVSNLIESLSKVPYMRNIELKSIEDVNEDGVWIKKFSITGETSL